MIKLILSILLCLNAYAATSDFKAHFFVNGKKIEGMRHAMVKPGTPTLVEVYFTNPKTNKVYKEFKIMHGKYMHMVIASKDLSVFKHIHPYFEPMTGRFSITLNMPHADPDNIDGVTTITKPGMYMIMADVIVKDVGMRMDHAMLMAMGQATQTELNPDPEINGVITKFFKRDNEERPMYKTVFSHNKIVGCSGNIVDFSVEMYRLENGEYIPMLDFEPWLKEAAHSVWMSKNYMAHMNGKMPFAHMHSSFVLDDDEDDTNDRVEDHILRFNFHDEEIMLPGIQKIWIQFKHRGKIMKVPFIFNYYPEEIPQC